MKNSSRAMLVLGLVLCGGSFVAAPASKVGWTNGLSGSALAAPPPAPPVDHPDLKKVVKQDGTAKPAGDAVSPSSTSKTKHARRIFGALYSRCRGGRCS